MRANPTSPTQTSQPKTPIKGRTESTNSRGTTGRLASTETRTFPDRVRSLRPTAPRASSGEARTGGREAPRISRRTTTGRRGMHRVFLRLFRRRSRGPKNPSRRWTAAEPSCKDPGIEAAVETCPDRLRGGRSKIVRQQRSHQTPVSMTWTGEETTSSRTESRSATTAGGWANPIGQILTTLSASGTGGRRTST